MIVLRPADAPASCATLWLGPNRALTRVGLHRLMLVLAVLTLTVSGLGAWQGNVFAPVFAVIESVAVAAALAAAWRVGERGECIRIDDASVQVQSLPGRRNARFPAYWVRVRLESGERRRRLMLASHGRRMEIGAFLTDQERVAVSEKLKTLLADVQDQWRSPV